MGWFSRKPSFDDLGLPRQFEVPEPDVLEADTRLIIATNCRLNDTGANGALPALGQPPAGQTFLLSPIWEPRDGVVSVRIAILPIQMLDYYLTGAVRKTIEQPKA